MGFVMQPHTQGKGEEPQRGVEEGAAAWWGLGVGDALESPFLAQLEKPGNSASSCVLSEQY